MESKVHVGIDISKNSFDVAIPLGIKDGYKHLKFSNNSDRKVLKSLSHIWNL